MIMPETKEKTEGEPHEDNRVENIKSWNNEEQKD